jgi:cytochrome c peroxidase
VPVPPHRPFSPEVVELGRSLFFDANLSATAEISCATCHVPAKAFANGEARGTGVHGRKTGRNVPSLLNAAFKPVLMWDGNPTTLEVQVKYPLGGYAEMDSKSERALLDYVRSRPKYISAFRSAMGIEPGDLTREHIFDVIAAYERTLVSGRSAFDRYYYGHDATALGSAARRGLGLFLGRARCTACHRVGESYALFMDGKFHTLGIGYDREKGAYADPGVGSVSNDDYAGMFFTPSLRNVAETAPYMHDGSIATLTDAILAHRPTPGVNEEREPDLAAAASLTVDDIADLVAFLRGLTGEERYIPSGQRL